MAEEKKEKWMTYLALSTVIVAVCATFSTFKGGGYSTKSLMNQQRASDQWSFFQSKSIKSYLFDMQKENLELQYDALKRDKSISKEKIETYKKKIDAYKEKLKGYDKEKQEIKKNAEGFEKERDEAKKHGEKFGMAVIFLQISILLSSIAALMKKKYIWVCGLIVGVFGIVYFLNGFWMFF